MLIKRNSTGLLVTLSIMLILPFVQKQWFNLYLFNTNNISFYSFLFYLSGIVCPSLICLNSLNNYTYYKFNKSIIYSKKSIKGKSLLFLVVINLIFLSYTTIDYAIINFDFICNLFLKGLNFQRPDPFQLSLCMFLVAIILTLKKSRTLFKKLILGNFVLISFYIWFIQINNINVDHHFQIKRYFGLNNLNLINVFILVAVEIYYFTWSYISNKNNLSDWIVHAPQKEDIINFLNMFIFYFFIIIYYSLLT